MDSAIEKAGAALKRAKEAGCGLLVLSGAGMSVASKVPVFRHADGTMSPAFLAFLDDYNRARARHGLPLADDWFSFSVPEMFRAETAREAWAYWRWRILRARVPQPGPDYVQLGRILDFFGREKSFVVTSNCDGLHGRPEGGGVDEGHLQEVHGSLARVQCSGACSNELWPVDEAFLSRLQKEPDWVPMCTKCNKHCLRPNVMIFGDDTLVYSVLREQKNNFDAFRFKLHNSQWIVLEIGAGVVVASIRYEAERLAEKGSGGLVRINPSRSECDQMQTANTLVATNKYFPIPGKSSDVLQPLADYLVERE